MNNHTAGRLIIGNARCTSHEINQYLIRDAHYRVFSNLTR